MEKSEIWIVFSTLPPGVKEKRNGLIKYTPCGIDGDESDVQSFCLDNDKSTVSSLPGCIIRT